MIYNAITFAKHGDILTTIKYDIYPVRLNEPLMSIMTITIKYEGTELSEELSNRLLKSNQSISVREHSI